MSEKNKVEVKIRGRFYTITANEPEEYIYKICTYVDKKMNEITQMNSRLSTEMASVLTAINVADDFYKVQSSEDNLRKQILKYDEEADGYERRIKELENQLAEKDEQLKTFLEQF
ncbi:MAG: cell division protein ZapA [Ruminococcaceae bacterium]|nr:cell division protein ZapA [Oscillospiraceae bacterium]